MSVTIDALQERQTMHLLVAIDPGLNSLGYGIFDIHTKSLAASGTIKENTRGQAIVNRIYTTIEDLDMHIGPVIDCQSSILVIEEPHQFGAYKSLASAGAGDLAKLMFLTGALMHWGIANFKITETIQVRTYRGQLPKPVVQKRMETKHSKKFQTNDESDAVYLGTWYLDANPNKLL